MKKLSREVQFINRTVKKNRVIKHPLLVAWVEKYNFYIHHKKIMVNYCTLYHGNLNLHFEKDEQTGETPDTQTVSLRQFKKFCKTRKLSYAYQTWHKNNYKPIDLFVMSDKYLAWHREQLTLTKCNVMALTDQINKHRLDRYSQYKRVVMLFDYITEKLLEKIKSNESMQIEVEVSRVHAICEVPDECFSMLKDIQIEVIKKETVYIFEFIG